MRVTMAVALEPEVADLVRKITRERGWSESRFIREAILAYLSRHSEGEDGNEDRSGNP